MKKYKYQVGGSLPLDTPFYIKREADQQLYEALKKGEFCYVLNSRQMGKSSLLVQTKYRLQQEGFRCAILDMTMMGSEQVTIAQWYKGIITNLCLQLDLWGEFNLKSWWQQYDDLPLIQRLERFFNQLINNCFPQDQIIIFIDEIDNILGLDFAVDDFFALIRFCFNQRAIDSAYYRLNFAVFGVATPSDLICDRIKTPFNIGQSIELKGFTFEEAKPLIKGLTLKTEHNELILQEILNWTAGQPFLTQKLCYLIVNLTQQMQRDKLTIPPGTEKLWVTNLVQEKVIKQWEFQDEPEHLRTITNRLTANSEKIGRILSIYQQILQKQSIIIDDSFEQIYLLLSGLVVNNQGFLKVKNPIYEQVFNLAWIEKQLANLRPYSQNIQAWIASQQQDKSRLLRGKSLAEAQLWSQGKSLSDVDYQFLAQSQELDRQEVQQSLEVAKAKAIKIQLQVERQNTKLQGILLIFVTFGLVITSGLGIFAWQQYRQARISEIKALISSANGLSASNNQLDAMLEALKAKHKLQEIDHLDSAITENADSALRQTIFNNNEANRLIGHQGSVLSVDISPNDQLIATGSNDKTVKIWQKDGKLLHTLKHNSTVHRVAFSPDNKFVVSASLDGKVTIWRVDGTLVRTIQVDQAPVWGVAVSPILVNANSPKNNQNPQQWIIASANSDRTIKLWNLEGKLLHTLTGHTHSVWNVAFSPDGSKLASAGVDRVVKIWDLQGKLLKTLKGHQNQVWDVAFCASNLLVSVSGDRTAKLWTVDGTLLKTLEVDKSILGTDCQGDFLATSGADNLVQIWKTDGTFIRNLPGHSAIIRDVALNSDGLMAVSASDDGTAKIWYRNQYLLKPLYGHQATVWDVIASPNGQLFASVGADDTLKLWDQDGKLLHNLAIPNTSFRSVVFTADSSMMVTVNTEKQIQLWDVSHPQVAPQLQKTLTGHQVGLFAVAISPIPPTPLNKRGEGEIIASAGDDQTIKIWNLQGKLLKTIKAHQERIWKLAFSADGQILASASEDGTVKLWDKNGNLKATLPHNGAVWGVAIDHQGIIASSSRDNQLKLWKLDGTLLKTIDGKSDGLTRVAISPSLNNGSKGGIIATGGVDNTVKLWNLDGKLLKTLPGHRGMVISLAFTADGKFLVSGGDDGTVIMWDLEKIKQLDELKYVCDWMGDYLRTNQKIQADDKNLCPQSQLIDHFKSQIQNYSYRNSK